MLKKLIVLSLLIFTGISSPVYAQNTAINTDIIIASEVEPLKNDGNFKQYKVIKADGKLLKKSDIKVKSDIKPAAQTPKTVKAVETKEKKPVETTKIPETALKNTEKELKKPEEEPKKPEGVTIVPENNKSTDATPKPEVISEPIPNEPQNNPKPLKLSPDQVKDLILKYSQKYNVDDQTLLRIAECESKFIPDLIGAGKYFGVFQFNKATFNEFAPELNFQNPDPLNPDQNIELAAYLISKGQIWRWGCK